MGRKHTSKVLFSTVSPNGIEKHLVFAGSIRSQKKEKETKKDIKIEYKQNDACLSKTKKGNDSSNKQR